MEAKPGIKSSELVVVMAGLLVAILPVVLDKVAPDSVWAVVLGALFAAATYVAGRSYVKGRALEQAAVSEAARALDAHAAKAVPPQPQP